MMKLLIKHADKSLYGFATQDSCSGLRALPVTVTVTATCHRSKTRTVIQAPQGTAQAMPSMLWEARRHLVSPQNWDPMTLIAIEEGRYFRVALLPRILLFVGGDCMLSALDGI